jgi:cytosine/adenosine deaminase-related metal-dependent hydrolase
MYAGSPARAFVTSSPLFWRSLHMRRIIVLACVSSLFAAAACGDPAGTSGSPGGDGTGGATDAGSTGTDPDGATTADGGGADGGGPGADASTTPGAHATCSVTRPGTAGFVLQGAVLAPSGVLPRGEVLVVGNTIACAAADCSATAGYAAATVIACPSSVISAGLINTHDHIDSAGAKPTAGGTTERFEHRNDWRAGTDSHTAVATVYATTKAESPTAQAASELRFLIGGATSTVSGSADGGAHGLLRNLDRAGFTEAGIATPPVKFETFPLTPNNSLEDDACTLKLKASSLTDFTASAAYLPHVAEGINGAARAELSCTDQFGIIAKKTAIIHGVGLSAKEIDRVAKAGAALIWSPRSNIALYGNTASVTVYKAMGVPIALGTDWMPSGSANLQRELACADGLNKRYLDGAFSDAELHAMVTSTAARATGADTQLGKLAAGYVADVAVFDASAHPGYRAVIDATGEDVSLVLRGGVPIYGDGDLLARPELQGSAFAALHVCGVAKRVRVDDTGFTIDAIKTVGEKVLPLGFCRGKAPPLEPTCTPARAALASSPTDTTGDTYPIAGATDDADGDGIRDAKDDCPRVFNPTRPMDGAAQADADGDGAGDACDLAPMDPSKH